MRDVAGKVAVITGAASGIGRGMAESFAAAGMKVVLSDVEEKALMHTIEALRDTNADVHGVVTDVTKAEQVQALGRLDYLAAPCSICKAQLPHVLKHYGMEDLDIGGVMDLVGQAIDFKAPIAGR